METLSMAFLRLRTNHPSEQHDEAGGAVGVEGGIGSRLAERMFETSSEGIVIVDGGRRILLVNPAFCAIMGYGAEALIGQRIDLLSSGRHGFAAVRVIWRLVRSGEVWRGELWARRGAGDVIPTWNSLSAVFDDAGRATHYIGIVSDISGTKSAEERIDFLTGYDQLTRLPNRQLLQRRFEIARDIANKSCGYLAILCFDLDNFKHVNDILGHSSGDLVLREVARRLCAGVGPNDTVSRQGGDEFLVLQTGVLARHSVNDLVEAVLARLAPPFQLNGHRVSVAASVGISLYPEDGTSFDVLFRKADTALFQAKRRGRNAAAYFTPAMNSASVDRLALHADLREALSRAEFSLQYQPFVDLSSGRIIGGEALLRWNSVERGLVAPGRFIPIAEESGLIVPIGSWVLNEVCRQNRQWRRAGGPELCLAVNVSALQLRAEGFVELVAQILAGNGLPPEALEIELTESMLISEADRMLEVVDRLKLLGVRLSIDDFGTGYSSLAYLKRLKVDKLKIDRSFVSNIAVNEDDGAIVTAILQMAQTLRLITIAEGVETIEQAEFLKSHNCQECQGYLFSHPVSAEQFEILVAAERVRKGREG